MCSLAKSRNSSMERLQKMFDSSLDVICSIDINGRFVDVNKASLLVWGYHPEELIGRPYKELVIEEDLTKTEDVVIKVLQGAQGTNFENRNYRKDGSIVPLFWSGRWDHEENLMFCTARDASERKVEEELRNFSIIAKETKSQVFFMNSDHIITWVNEAFTALTGYTFEEAVGKRPSELFVGPGTDPEIIRYIDEELSKNKPFRYEILNYTKDHKKYWMERSCQPIVDENGVVQKYFFIGTDITERKKTEMELQKLSLVVRNSEHMVVITNVDRTIEWVNDAFTKGTGYTLEEVIGKYPSQLLHGPETDPGTVRWMSEQIVKGKSFRVELLGYTKSKETFWSELYFQPVLDDLGKVQQYFTIQKDITEYKKLQEQLMKEQKNRQQMITAATIKAQEHERANVGLELHDNVNQVLTTVKLYLELCRDGLANRDLMNKSINLVHESINEIRSLSKRLSAPSLGDIKLKESVKELVDTVAASNKIEITLDATCIEELEADQELHLAIYRILQEHLTNILRHANAQLVYISFDIEDNELMLKVVDDGNGFDTRKRKNGVGITNMISRAESLNGTLIIDSAPGLGCVLSARFPLG